jgi:pimeloyl-ACP methyl ester carboxylesterase
MAQPPETRFTRAGDVDIAYQVVGPASQFDLVFVPGWVSHLEVMWELPEFARFLDRLAAMGRLIMFDKRGTGLSDRVAGMATLEQRADDFAEVMDAAGSARAAIIAWGEGAAIAAMFAAAHPDRVTALVLGTLPVKVTDGQRPLIPDPALLRELSVAVETAWGRPAWYRCSRRPGPMTPGSCPGTGGGSACRRPRARRRRHSAGPWSSIWGRSCRRSRPGR